MEIEKIDGENQPVQVASVLEGRLGNDEFVYKPEALGKRRKPCDD